MWIAKFVITPIKLKETIIDRYARKYRVSAQGFPLTIYKEKGKYFFVTAGVVNAPEKKLKEMIKELKKDPQVRNIEMAGGLLTIHCEGNIAEKELYDPHFVATSPIKVTPEGTETWELGCWDRNRLTRLIAFLKKKYKITLLGLTERKLSHLAMIQVIPSLTKKQRQAITLAIDSGYYSTPREIELKELAKLNKISFSTYRQHLRKAEEKFFKQLRTAI